MARDDFKPRLAETLTNEVARHVAARIDSGDIDGQLPSEDALSTDYGVSVVTVRRSLAVLRSQGVIVTVPGKGSFVAEQ